MTRTLAGNKTGTDSTQNCKKDPAEEKVRYAGDTNWGDGIARDRSRAPVEAFLSRSNLLELSGWLFGDSIVRNVLTILTIRYYWYFMQ
jgi:hypothetical protein